MLESVIMSGLYLAKKNRYDLPSLLVPVLLSLVAFFLYFHSIPASAYGLFFLGIFYLSMIKNIYTMVNHYADSSFQAYFSNLPWLWIHVLVFQIVEVYPEVMMSSIVFNVILYKVVHPSLFLFLSLFVLTPLVMSFGILVSVIWIVLMARVLTGAGIDVKGSIMLGELFWMAILGLLFYMSPFGLLLPGAVLAYSVYLPFPFLKSQRQIKDYSSWFKRNKPLFFFLIRDTIQGVRSWGFPMFSIGSILIIVSIIPRVTQFLVLFFVIQFLVLVSHQTLSREGARYLLLDQYPLKQETKWLSITLSTLMTFILPAYVVFILSLSKLLGYFPLVMAITILLGFATLISHNHALNLVYQRHYKNLEHKIYRIWLETVLVVSVFIAIAFLAPGWLGVIIALLVWFLWLRIDTRTVRKKSL